MLVVSRNPGESVVLTLPDGRKVWCHVLRVDGNKVRVGVDAPDDVAIRRSEIPEKQENR